MSMFKSASVIAGLCAALFSVQASAGVVTYNTRTTFDAQGTIVHNSNFDDFSGSFSFPGDPFTRGDVTYDNTNNLIVGDCSYSIGCVRRVITNNYWTPLEGDISTASNNYDLFGFDLAVTSGPVTVTVITNLTSYVFSGLTVGNGSPAFTFLGFEATGGEHFTGFRIDTNGPGFLPGMTDVALGLVGGSSVPEPTSLALAGLALAGLAAASRRKA